MGIVARGAVNLEGFIRFNAILDLLCRSPCGQTVFWGTRRAKPAVDGYWTRSKLRRPRIWARANSLKPVRSRVESPKRSAMSAPYARRFFAGPEGGRCSHEMAPPRAQ
jgi:hypothetical protein